MADDCEEAKKAAYRQGYTEGAKGVMNYAAKHLPPKEYDWLRDWHGRLMAQWGIKGLRDRQALRRAKRP